MSQTYYIRTKGDERAVDYFWAGKGWWTRRKDQAMRFDTREAAETEKEAAVTIEVVDAREPATAE